MSDDGWLVVYAERDRSTATPDPNIVVTRVRPDGSVAGSRSLAIDPLNEIVPRVAGRDGRYLVTFGVIQAHPNAVWSHSPVIAARRVDWPLSRFTNFGPTRTLFGVQGSLTTYVNESLAYDDVSRSYWEIVTTRSPGFVVEARRIGYDLVVTERVRLLTTGFRAGVTFNDDAREFAVVHADRTSLRNVWGSRIGPPQGSVTTYGTGCGPARILSRNLGLLGSEFFTVRLLSAFANQPAVLLLAPAPGSLPLDSIGMPGCTLLLSSTGLSVVAMTDRNGSAALQLSIPSIPGLRDLYFQWVHFAPGANALGLRTTAGLHVRTQ